MGRSLSPPVPGPPLICGGSRLVAGSGWTCVCNSNRQAVPPTTVATTVTTAVVPNTNHWVMEEDPGYVLNLMTGFFND